MKVILVGAGRFGRFYVDYLLDCKSEDISLVGIVEKYIDRSPVKDEILASGVPIYDSLSDFYEKDTADLVILSTPAFLHRDGCVEALAHGSNVLSEKPLTPTMAEANEIMALEKSTGKFAAIGYQWSYDSVIQELKKDIISGVLGKPKKFKTRLCWPRTYEYYSSGWSGCISKDGRLVLDSIASNATAHYIHNMFFILGESMDKSASPVSVKAECLRANDIESYDTAVLKMTMKDGVELYYIASHAAEGKNTTIIEYEFENATVKFSWETKNKLVAFFKNGEVKEYGQTADSVNVWSKIGACIDAIKQGTTPICTAETAAPHVNLLENIYKNVKIVDFPKERIVRREDGIHVTGLSQDIADAYEKGAMLSELPGYEFLSTTEFKNS